MSSNPVDDRKALLKNALVALDEMQAKLDAVERQKKEPIAIVGMSCRFPGGANNPDAYWELLRNGVDAIREFPAERANVQEYAGKDTVWYGGFLDDIDQFDAQFFGISPREANTMDPQQRLVLEVAWEALENAGIAPDQLSGSLTGVFIGVTTNDYAQLVKQSSGLDMDIYSATGTALNVTAGRLAYLLGLQGPCAALDTACSSSLVAIHLACQSLRNRDSDMVITGGVNATLAPENFICFTGWGMMASDGRCKTFDSRADGFVRGEGCGIIVLKRLSDALADGDRILAVIRGSAVNEDGHSSGLTVPNGVAQQAVIRRALASGDVQPAEVSYVETHGTGTTLGDPIEVEAIGAVFADGRQNRPMILGAVKSNIGHLESASGVAGLIKVVLAMQHGELPPNLHFHERSPRIPWPDFPVIIPTEPMLWDDHPRVAGVSSFGFSGVNAHVVLADAPVPEYTVPELERPLHLMTLSAKSESALRQLASQYANVFTSSDVSLADAAYTANVGRAHFNHRLALTAESLSQAHERLAAFAAGKDSQGLVAGQASSSRQKVAFLFTGQGSQYVGMGRELYETQPSFRAALDECDRLLRPYLQQSLLSVLYPEEGVDSPIDHTRYTQPTLFALEYALAKLWQSWGIEPSAVMGHSVGEYVAACIAGVFSLEDGLKLIATRGQLMGDLPKGGQMTAVFADETTVAASIAPYADQLSVAAVNGTENTVISGTGEAMRAVVKALNQQGIKTRPLVVSHAFHSPLMNPVLDAFETVAREVRFSRPRIKLLSNVTGQFAESEVQTPQYWRKHIREAVRFGDSIQTLFEKGYTAFVEIGPGSTLLSMGQRCVPEDADLLWLPSLRKGHDDWTQLLKSLGTLYVHGTMVDWAGFDRDYPRRKLALPTYPFQRERHWVSQSADQLMPRASYKVDQSAHPLLGSQLNLAKQDEFMWENQINLSRLPYLADHRVEGAIIVPATAYVEMGIAAAIQIVGHQPLTISGVTNHKPLFLHEDASYIVQTVLKKSADSALIFEVYSRPVQDNPLTSAWTLHVSGRILPSGEQLTSKLGNTLDVQAVIARCAQEVSGESFYRQLGEKGNQWGPNFQGIQRIWQGEGEALSLVHVPESLEREVDRYQLHPAVSDSCGHVLTATISMEKADGNKGGAFVGGGIDESRFYDHPTGKQLWCYARLRADEGDENVLIGDVAVFDENGFLVTETVGARLWYLDHQNPAPPPLENVDNWFYEIEWQPKESPDGAVALSGDWLILADSGGVAEQVAARLESQGGRCVLVYAGNAWEQTDERTYRVRPGEREDFSAVLQAAAWRGIVHLWSLDTGRVDVLTMHALEASHHLSLTSTLLLVQALALQNWAQSPRLWLVTQNGQPFNEQAVQVAQSPLWGMGRALALEHAEFWGGLIDLDSQMSPEESSAALLQALAHEDGEDQTAIRAGQTYVARLMRKPMDVKVTPLLCRPDGSYLITGGLGGIGLETAFWLVQKGARRLILMGRTALPPRQAWKQVEPDSRTGRQIAGVLALEALGASVHLAFVDVADESQMREFLETYHAEGWPPIRGIFHAAGVMQYQPIIEHTPEEMAQILRAKVTGGWLLHRLLQESPLDWFVMYSSASALLSSPLTTSYSAANAFLDALAHERRRLGLPALSVNWGVWGEVGMVVEFGGIRQDAVMQPMPTAMCFEALERCLATDASQVAVMAANWRQWEKLNAAFTQSRLLTNLLSESVPETVLPTQAASSRQRIAAAAPEEREGLLSSLLTEHIARILGFSSANLSPTQPLSLLGMDSLMAVELKNRMEMDLGVVMPIVQLLQGPSVSELTTIVMEQISFSGDTSADEAARISSTAAADDSWEEGEL